MSWFIILCLLSLSQRVLRRLLPGQWYVRMYTCLINIQNTIGSLNMSFCSVYSRLSEWRNMPRRRLLFVLLHLLCLSQWVHRILLPVQRYLCTHHWQHLPKQSWSMNYMYTLSVDCSPACKNGGTCVTSFWSSPRCDCPSGYFGSYCQYKSMYIRTYMRICNPRSMYTAVDPRNINCTYLYS